MTLKPSNISILVRQVPCSEVVTSWFAERNRVKIAALNTNQRVRDRPAGSKAIKGTQHGVLAFYNAIAELEV